LPLVLILPSALHHLLVEQWKLRTLTAHGAEIIKFSISNKSLKQSKNGKKT